MLNISFYINFSSQTYEKQCSPNFVGFTFASKSQGWISNFMKMIFFTNLNITDTYFTEIMIHFKVLSVKDMFLITVLFKAKHLVDRL